jgi:kynurenine formamidase
VTRIDVVPHEYLLLLIPVKIAGTEAAPARAFFLEKRLQEI